MAVNATVIKALKAVYSRETLVSMRAQAAAEVAAGVQVTQVTFEGGGASGRPTSTPAEVLELIQTVIESYDDEGAAVRPASSFVDLSGRMWGT